MTENTKHYPEPSNFQETLDETAKGIIDRIYRTFTENDDAEVREWASDYDIVGARPTFAPVIEHYAKALFRHFYQVGFHQGATAKLADAGALGERTIVTKHHADGRIAEMVKLPLSVAERQAFEAHKAGATV